MEDVVEDYDIAFFLYLIFVGVLIWTLDGVLIFHLLTNTR